MRRLFKAGDFMKKEASGKSRKSFSEKTKKIIEIIEYTITFVILILVEYHHFQNR